MGHLSLFLFVTTLFRDRIDRFVPEKHVNNNIWDRNIIYSPKTISFVSEKRNLDRFRDKCPGSSQSTHFLRHAPVLRSDAPCPDRDRPSGLFHIFRKTPHMVTSVTISDENPISWNYLAEKFHEIALKHFSWNKNHSPASKHAEMFHKKEKIRHLVTSVTAWRKNGISWNIHLSFIKSRTSRHFTTDKSWSHKHASR